jgi:HNH endonuclease
VSRKRKQLSKKQRFELFKRDGFTCQYCGAHPPGVVLVLDHIVPFAEGGACDDDNLVTACEACNQGKAARGLSQVPASLADKAAEVAEREAQLRGFHEVMEARRDRIEADAWEVADIFIDGFRKDGIRKDWLQSIRYFNEQMGKFEVMNAMEIAVSRKHSERQCFMYFCGICWNRIRGPQ